MKTTITVSILIISLFVTSCAQALNDKFDDASGKLQAATGIENLDRMDGGKFNDEWINGVPVRSCLSVYWDDYTEIYLEAGKSKKFPISIRQGYCLQLLASNSLDSDYVEYCSGKAKKAANASLTLSDNEGNSYWTDGNRWIYGSPETEDFTYIVTLEASTSGYVALYCWQVPSLNYVDSGSNAGSDYFAGGYTAHYSSISLTAGRQYTLSFDNSRTDLGNYIDGLIVIYDVSDGSCVCVLSALESQSKTFAVGRSNQYVIGVQKLGSPVDDGWVGWSISTSN